MPKKRRGRTGRRGKPPAPFPWADSSENLSKAARAAGKLLPRVIDAARAGQTPTLEDVRTWHDALLEDVVVAEPSVRGGLRGEGPSDGQLSNYANRVGNRAGEHPREVARRVASFFAELDRRVSDMEQVPSRVAGRQLRPAMELCAWAHGEWVRMHPFADFNGTTARLLAVAVAARLGIPLSIPIKPRPSGLLAISQLSYSSCAAAQMSGYDGLMAAYFEAAVGGRAS